MPTVRHIRELDDGRCTIGRFFLPMGQTLFTLERPWLNNQRGVSCFPAPGSYPAILRQSPHLGLTYWLPSVPDRSFILIHSANIVTQLEGCIALGLMRGWLKSERAVFQSVTAVRKFMQIMGKQPFTLEVV